MKPLANGYTPFPVRPSSYQLAASSDHPHRRAISERFDARQLAERKPATVTRTGQFWDPRYGEFEITPAMLAEMVRNFNQRTYGQDIFIDVAHKPDEGSAGRVTRLRVEGDRLLADVEWTPYGRQAITERGYQYLSAEFIDNYVDNERRQAHGALLFGAGLTIRPVIKRLDPIQLSEPTGLHHALADTLLKEATKTVNKYLEDLIKRLGELGISQAVVDQLAAAYKTAAKGLGEDDAALKTLAEQMAATGKILAEKLGDKPATIQITLPTPAQKPEPAAKTLTAEDVRTLLAEYRQREAEKAAATAKTLAERQTQFRTLLEASESVKALAEPQQATLKEAEQLITAAFTSDQVEALAKQQLKLAEQIAVSSKLAALGFKAKGSTHIQVLDQATPLKLQESINQQLRNSPSAGNLRLLEDKHLKPVVRRILAEFDRRNAEALAAEAKFLADGGPTLISNINVPVGFQRTVIREALSDLNILDLVQVLTDPLAKATTQIPYELRKPGTIVNDGIVYEGQGIPRASVEQKMDTAYVNKMALSLLISNEVALFSRTSDIDWDAYARNVDSNARLMRELVARRVANEMQRSTDAYSPTTRTAESVTVQLNGANSLLKTTYWPIVRPLLLRDLQGNAISTTANPITVVINSTAVNPYDGTGTQAAGTYYVVENYNLGFIRLVNQAGTPVTPANTGTNTVTYASANNLVKYDLKLPAGVALEDHLNGALRAIGARKAMMSGDRYIMPDFQLMSPMLNDSLTNARQFTESSQVAGAGLSNVGDLATVKGIPSFGTNAPNIDLGDERIILGQRGTLAYVIVKPFETGQPFEAVNSNGLPTGERIAYGEEYNAIHVPSPINNRLTSVILYDSDARTAAA
jgi:hypothetical protein